MSERSARIALALMFVTLGILGACKGAQQSGTALAASPPHLICEHQDFPFSDWVCSDTNASRQAINHGDVDSMSLVVYTKSGRMHVTPITTRTDAIFLTKRTADTILARYYLSNGDATKAKALRDKLGQYP
jgi:hypothetical protein